MVTFGVIHGLIQRVHEYPMAFGEGIEPPKDITKSKGRITNRQGSTASSVPSIGKEIYSSDNSIKGETPKRGNFTTNFLGQEKQSVVSQPGHEEEMRQKIEEQKKKLIEEHKRREEIKLAFKAAASMDGTKCDDELYSIYQRPISKLKAIVKLHTKKEIVSVYSTDIVPDCF